MEIRKELQELRLGFNALYASEHPSTLEYVKVFKDKLAAYSGNIFYEELKSVSYQPDLKRLEAIFATKQEYGYLGNLCTNGSHAYVRFYLDYGAGWEDQGYTGVNQHDIPTSTDCRQNPEKPLSYSASLNITPKTNFCNVHVLPKVRAILEWNKIPPANSPNYHSIWGNTFDDRVQIKPRRKIIFEKLDLSQLIETAIIQPNLTLSDAAKTFAGGDALLQQVQSTLALQPLDIGTLAGLYKGTVSVGRFALQHVKASLDTTDSNIISQNIESFKQYGINWVDILNELFKTKADVSYEQLESVGLDYNLEQLVASVRIKRPSGYSGDLCTHGSYEYVSFWADLNNDCNWHHLGTTSINVHDLSDIPAGGLSYAAVLPYDFNSIRKLCANPEVVKIRAVLSWNVEPSKTDADKLEYWGNRVDAYVQIRPGIGTGELEPLMSIVGGITVNEINNATGLTIPGAKFALNQIGVYNHSPFGGVIVIQGPSFFGHNYRIKVTNTATSASYYLTNTFATTALAPAPQYVQTHYVSINASGYYPYQEYHNNIESVLARWSPGTNDLLKLELEIEGVAGVFTKYIQMDNTAPDIHLSVDDLGDCTHYAVGAPITATYSVYDAHLQSYALVSTFGGPAVTGNSNASGSHVFATAGATTPCGKIYLSAVEKTIYDSQWTGNNVYNERIICLKK
ncbi:hypothetical protein QTN47_19070 [Danxiaibacter flavus]|uniref:Uncharacterized protein n=1 Tax=Danxiaibacter flavus TaxID=3049108 RepID=A0ABV3ZMA0_9BACT|nr:hypothetical protein QNM32_19080 [Chitinophagaceae bacterium DXS]